MEPAVAAAEEEEDEENKTEQEVVNDNQRQTAVEMVENAAVKEATTTTAAAAAAALENHHHQAEKEENDNDNDNDKHKDMNASEDVKGDSMDIDQKAKQLEAGKKTEENEKSQDDEVEKDVEGDEEEKNRTLKPTKKRPGRPKKEGAKSEEEGSTPCESSVKRKRQKKEIFPSYIDRPTRERKSIERFIASSVEKESSKDFQIKQVSQAPFLSLFFFWLQHFSRFSKDNQRRFSESADSIT
jgi:protein DEK